MLDYKIPRETFRSDTKHLGFDELHFWSTEVLKANAHYLQSELAVPDPGSRGEKLKYSLSFSILFNMQKLQEKRNRQVKTLRAAE